MVIAFSTIVTFLLHYGYLSGNNQSTWLLGLPIGIVAAILVLLLYLFCYLIYSVIAVEDLTFKAILDETASLVSASSWRGILFVLLSVVVMYAISWLFALPVQLSQIDLTHYSKLPVWARILYVVDAFARTVIIYPLGIICNAYFYNDIKLRLATSATA